MQGDNRPGVFYRAGRIIEKMGDEAFDRDKELEDLQTLTSLRKAYGDDAFQMAAALDKLGDDYAGRKQYDQALKQYGLALDIRCAGARATPASPSPITISATSTRSKVDMTLPWET